MAYVYLIVALSWLLGLLCLAVLLAPPVLWFLHRRDANFARPVRWVARIDLAFILSWFVSFFFFNLRDVRPDGVGYDLLYIVFGLLTLIAVWKMKAGEGFRGLFRNPGTGNFPFAVYLLTAAGVAVVTVVSLVSYVIVAACIVLLFWLLFIKLDVLSMAFGGSGGGGGLSLGGFGGGSGGGADTDGSWPLMQGDETCDAKVEDPSCGICNLNKVSETAFEDQYGRRWEKTQNGKVRLF